MKKKPIDQNQVKTFFEPNLGLPRHGAEAAMPKVVKKVADELDGKTMTIKEAVAKIEAVLNGAGEVSLEEGCILLWSEPISQVDLSNLERPLHSWRVIKFR